MQEVTVNRTTRCRLGLSVRPEMKSPLPRNGTQEGSSRVTEGAPLTVGKKGRTDRGGKRRGSREGRESEELRGEKRGREREGGEEGGGREGKDRGKRARGEARDERAGAG